MSASEWREFTCSWEAGTHPKDYTVSYDTYIGGHQPQTLRIEIPIPAGDYHVVVTVKTKETSSDA